MITLLSPAKRLDEESRLPTRKHHQPRLLDDSRELMQVLKPMGAANVAGLLGISDELAALNVGRYQEWQPPFTPRNARPALFLFAGDVYQGMNAAERFDGWALTYADKTIRILSGLYGLLRPLDLIQPYRLEMGTNLRTKRGVDLYEFWGPTITDLIASDLKDSPGSEAVVNLASGEYSGAVDPERLGVPFVSPRFEDETARGGYAVVSFSAKRARGDMAAWMVENRVRSPRALKDYDGLGYRYSKNLSTAAVPVFRRGRRA